MAKSIPYEENHKEINGIVYKKCNKHNLYFPDEDAWLPATLEYYYKNKCSPDTLNTWCKKCAVKKSWIRNMNNKEQWIEGKRRYFASARGKEMSRKSTKKYRELGKYKIYQQNNLEKFKLYNQKRQHKNHKISTKEWTECKLYFNMRCAYCGLPIEEHYINFKGITKLGDFHKEHVDHNGSNDLSNCIPSCKNCNCEKWEFDFNDWYNKDNYRFSQERYNRIVKWINDDYKKYMINTTNIT